MIAADLIDFRAHDPAHETEFREWLRMVRREPLDTDEGRRTVIGTHEGSPSNWGGMAGASRVAIAGTLIPPGRAASTPKEGRRTGTRSKVPFQTTAARRGVHLAYSVYQVPP